MEQNNMETGSDRSASPKGSPAGVKQESSPRVHHSPPPPVSQAGGMMRSHLPLPPPGLGILGMVPHSPLDLMAVAHHHPPPRSYSSPPPISTSDPTANECKLVDYRGQKVAAFIIAGDTMLCLPQAFELFLKHLVGGLHTVYTKLKRLDIVPLVCNVEQVRILRGLGAIQPGVNRCKLLSCKDFDILYRDCTTARCLMTNKATERPGRPPKRAPVGLSLAASHLSQQIKKHRMDNGDYPSSGYENGHISETFYWIALKKQKQDAPRLEKSPLLANGYNHPPTHLNHMQFMQLNHPGSGHTAILNPQLQHHLIKPPPPMDALSRSGIWENCRAAYEDIVKHLERLREERGETERALALDQKPRDLSSHNGSSTGQSPVLNLSKSNCEASGSEAGGTGPEDEDEEDEGGESDQDDVSDKEQELSDTGEGAPSPATASPHALNYSAALSTPAQPTSDPTISSTETLLRNIQGLLKVAADNARQQERQINYEKAELKMDVLREREVKDSLERQLLDEQKMRALYQKRLRKEKKARRRLQDQLELEMKRRSQLEEALKAAGAPPEALRVLTESCSSGGAGNGNGSGERGAASSGASGERRSAEREAGEQPPSGGGGYQGSQNRDPPPPPPQDKPWNYSSIDLINSGAQAFWQNYSESLAQELELERKSRQQQAERDKSPLQDARPGYYKNSVLFSSAT
ncbi:dachshund homolog 2 isoform X3 [Halyomorpha halys]|uniref:dachshund homolog 2 isoform X3 n=1 Tax=Halyomorpha halys TaxID=286706 RepID=UPI0006D4EF39